jgi:tRNA threonylcarbamoyl adenosine modification protein YeaZ
MTTVALGITASSRGFSVAVRRDDGSVHVSDPTAAKGASDITAVVAAMFQRCGATPRQLAEIRLDLGPGSYTGLRVAVTFARVTAHFQDIPVRTTTSLELMALAAWNANAARDCATIRPVLDARRNRFHHAAVRMDDTATLLSEPRATELEELLNSIQDGETLLTTPAVRATLDALAKEVVFVEPAPFDAALLFNTRLGTRATAIDELEPLYLMGSYAESNRTRK